MSSQWHPVGVDPQQARQFERLTGYDANVDQQQAREFERLTGYNPNIDPRLFEWNAPSASIQPRSSMPYSLPTPESAARAQYIMAHGHNSTYHPPQPPVMQQGSARHSQRHHVYPDGDTNSATLQFHPRGERPSNAPLPSFHQQQVTQQQQRRFRPQMQTFQSQQASRAQQVLHTQDVFQPPRIPRNQQLQSCPSDSHHRKVTRNGHQGGLQDDQNALHPYSHAQSNDDSQVGLQALPISTEQERSAPRETGTRFQPRPKARESWQGLDRPMYTPPSVLANLMRSISSSQQTHNSPQDRPRMRRQQTMGRISADQHTQTSNAAVPCLPVPYANMSERPNQVTSPPITIDASELPRQRRPPSTIRKPHNHEALSGSSSTVDLTTSLRDKESANDGDVAIREDTLTSFPPAYTSQSMDQTSETMKQSMSLQQPGATSTKPTAKKRFRKDMEAEDSEHAQPGPSQKKARAPRKSASKKNASMPGPVQSTTEALKKLDAQIASRAVDASDYTFEDEYATIEAAKARRNRTDPDIKFHKVIDEDSDDLKLVDDKVMSELRRLLFGSFMQPYQKASADLSEADQARLNKQHEIQYQNVKDRMANSEDRKDIDAILTILIDIVKKVHTKGIALADLNLKRLPEAASEHNNFDNVASSKIRTKANHQVEHDVSFINRILKIADHIKNNKYVANDVCKENNLFDLVCAPDAYEKTKRFNAKTNKKKQVKLNIAKRVEEAEKKKAIGKIDADEDGDEGENVQQGAEEEAEEAEGDMSQDDEIELEESIDGDATAPTANQDPAPKKKGARRRMRGKKGKETPIEMV